LFYTLAASSRTCNLSKRDITRTRCDTQTLNPNGSCGVRSRKEEEERMKMYEGKWDREMKGRWDLSENFMLCSCSMLRTKKSQRHDATGGDRGVGPRDPKLPLFLHLRLPSSCSSFTDFTFIGIYACTHTRMHTRMHACARTGRGAELREHQLKADWHEIRQCRRCWNPCF